MKRPTVFPGQFPASLLSLATGLLLVGGIHVTGEGDVDPARVAAGLLVALARRPPPAWAGGGPGAVGPARRTPPAAWS